MTGNVLDVMKNKGRRLCIQYPIHESVGFGVLLAIVGGFLDAYTYIARGGVFANAQTGNIVLVGVYAAKGEWGKALVPVVPILAFVIGVIVAEVIRNNSSRFFILDWIRAVLILEIVVLFIIGFVPHTVSNNIVTVTISFVASVQVSSFRKLVDSPYCTTMSTGNLRTGSQAAYIALTQKDHKEAVKAIRFFTIILSFLFGAFLGGFITLLADVKAIWGAVIILIITVILFSISEKRQRDN